MGYKNNVSVIYRVNMISRYEMGIKKRQQTDARNHLLSVSNNCMEWAAGKFTEVSHLD